MGAQKLTYYHSLEVLKENPSAFLKVLGKSKPKPEKRLDYFTYGMTMPGRNGSISENYRYAFNGMETDGEVSGSGNSYTTQFRQYDPRLGRWKSTDPLKARFPWQSPFSGMDDNPVALTDRLGLSTGKGEPEGGGDGSRSNPYKKGEFDMDDLRAADPQRKTIYYIEDGVIFKAEYSGAANGQWTIYYKGASSNTDWTKSSGGVKSNHAKQNTGKTTEKKSENSSSKGKGHSYQSQETYNVQVVTGTSGDVLQAAGSNKIASAVSKYDDIWMTGSMTRLLGNTATGVSVFMSISKINNGTPQDKAEGTIEITLAGASYIGPLGWLPGAVYSVASYNKEGTKQLNKDMQKAYQYNKTALDNENAQRINHMYNSDSKQSWHNCGCYETYPDYATWIGNGGYGAPPPINNSFAEAYQDIIINGNYNMVKYYYNKGVLPNEFMDNRSLWQYWVDGITGGR